MTRMTDQGDTGDKGDVYTCNCAHVHRVYVCVHVCCHMQCSVRMFVQACCVHGGFQSLQVGLKVCMGSFGMVLSV